MNGPCKPLAMIATALIVTTVPSIWPLLSGRVNAAARILTAGRANDTQRQANGKFTAAELERLWWDLADEPSTACRAMRKLMAAPEQSLALLADRLTPAIAIDRGRLEKLAGDLDSKDTQVRQRAATALVHYGELSGPALRKALADLPPLETRPAAEVVLEIISDQPRPAEVQRVLRAVEVLERLGTPAARAVLNKLAAGADGHSLTDEARAALIRLARQRNAP
jgi:hypothetical protein